MLAQLYEQPRVAVVQQLFIVDTRPLSEVVVPRLREAAPWPEQYPVFVLLSEAKDARVNARTAFAREAAQRVWVECRNSIAAANIGLVFKVLRKQSGSPEEKESAAFEALCKAIDAFDVNRGYRFSTYAVNAINSAMWRTWRKDNHFASHYHQEGLNTDGSGKLAESSSCTEAVADRAERDEQGSRARRLLEEMNLSDIERAVIRCRFLADPPLTLLEIGRGFQLTRQRIEQIEKSVLRKLRRAMEGGR